MLLDAVLDLVWGGACVACDRPGRSLCRACQEDLLPHPQDAWPQPTPGGLVRPVASAAYDGTIRDILIALKERGRHGLVPVAAEFLATSVHHLDLSGALALVPVPSRPAAVRTRGLDTSAAVCRHAVGALRCAGLEVTYAPLLRTRPGLADQAGLSAGDRAANLERAFTCPAPGVRALARRQPRATVVLCDDILTTGATAREGQRALEAVGLTVGGIAAVAATARRGTVHINRL